MVLNTSNIHSIGEKECSTCLPHTGITADRDLHFASHGRTDLACVYHKPQTSNEGLHL